LPQSVRGGGPPAGGRSSMTSMRGGGGSSIRSSGGGSQVGGGGSPIQRGATVGPCAGKRRRGGGTSKAGEQATPVDVRVPTATHEARCSSERRHGRREMRAAMIALDILRSGAVWAARVTTYICTCVIDDVLPATTSFDSCFLFDYCVLCLSHVLFTLKMYDFMLEHGVRISVYCMHIGKTIP
jgi:hypothetical protein